MTMTMTMAVAMAELYIIRFVFLLSAFLSLPVVGEPLLENYYWRATSIGGEKLRLAAAQIPHIAFHKQENRVAGFGGCNRFFATYGQDGMNLTISIMGGGRANCAETSQLEQQFLQSLQRTQTYKIEESTLYLTNGAEVLGEFVGVER